ncbi:MAG TPA: hypothetical protein VMU83_01680 [Hanamia sp.]|nr:hypothetical protein [Hanamia sp.]
MKTLDQSLDTIMQMDFISREMLLEILQKRQIEERRQEIAKNGKRAKADFKSGKINPADANDIIHILNASLSK